MTKGNSTESEIIVSEIRSRIERGLWQPGQRLPSERSLAVEFSVSRVQIQAAIDQLNLLGLIEQLPNCRPTVRDVDASRHRKARSRRNQIALWIHPNSEDMGASMILKGIRQAIGAAGYSAVIGCPDSPQSHSEEAFIRSLAKSSSVAGAIIWPSGDDTWEAYESLKATGLPFVFVDREPPQASNVDVVSSNNFKAAKTAVEHLISLGHRKIAMVRNTEDVSSVRDRIDGYFAALRFAGLEAPARMPYSLPFGLVPEASARAHEFVRGLSTSMDGVTAVFAVNDMVAMHLYDAATAQGVRIPEDFSLIGFDWFMRWVPSGGHLTTVCQHFEDIGRIAVDRLLERIDSPAIFVPRHTLVEAPLILKSSTSSPYLA